MKAAILPYIFFLLFSSLHASPTTPAGDAATKASWESFKLQVYSRLDLDQQDLMEAAVAAAGEPSLMAAGPPTRANPNPVLTLQDLARRTAELNLPVRLGTYTTGYTHAIPSQEVNIALAASYISGVVVQPGQTFSYNAAVGPYSQGNGYGLGRMFVGHRIVPSIGGGVCQVATTLYNAVVLSNLQVVERHKHGLTVPYLPPGQDATVSEGHLDFKFRNDLPWPVMVHAVGADKVLTVSIYGREKGPPVRWEHETLETYAKWTESVGDPETPRGETRELAPGQDGVKVRSWIVVGTPNGEVRRDMGISTYKASPRVVGVGTGPPRPSQDR
ncbi:MAG: VanW family protein [Bacillota bacterium]